jgi:integrase
MIKLYRRHTDLCLNGEDDKGGLKQRGLTSAQLDGWKHCHCPVWRKGSYNKSPYRRESLQVNSWGAAEAKVKKMMNDLDDGVKRPKGRIDLTIKDALSRWDAHCIGISLAESTMVQHRILARDFEGFALKHHRTMLSHLDGDTELIGKLCQEWKSRNYKFNTERGKLACVSAFFHFVCGVGRKWITENPMADVVIPQALAPALKEDTMPVDLDGTDTNYKKILAALAGWTYDKVPFLHLLRQNPLRLSALCKLMYEAGFRISDALLFNLDKVEIDGEVASYTYIPFKVRRFRKPCTTFFPLWLYHEIKALGNLSPGRPFWDVPEWDGTYTKSIDKPMKRQKMVVWWALVRAGEKVGVPNLHAHRYRNSLAVNAIKRNARIEDISKWLGHASVRITERCYLPWVKSRLDASRRAYLAMQAPPPPNVVVMGGVTGKKRKRSA